MIEARQFLLSKKRELDIATKQLRRESSTLLSGRPLGARNLDTPKPPAGKRGKKNAPKAATKTSKAKKTKTEEAAAA